MIQRFYWILGLKARISSSSSKLSSKQRLPRYIVVVSLQRFIFLFLKAKTFMLCSCHFWKSLCKLRPFYRNSFRLLIDTVGQNSSKIGMTRKVGNQALDFKYQVSLSFRSTLSKLKVSTLSFSWKIKYFIKQIIFSRLGILHDFLISSF